MQTGNNWQAQVSRQTFDELKSYIMVEKEMKVPGTTQPVPLLDSELNENAEILLTLIRRLVYDIYGNGTDGDGFQIIQSGSNPTNNFTIKGGGGTADTAGRIFVHGWMPIIANNIEYTSQSGVSALTTPGVDRIDEVYLDVFYSEISPDQDPDIIDPQVGFETSRRIKLVWAVKVIENGTTPFPYTDANNIRHWTCPIAKLARLSGNATITTAMITDLRRSALGLKRREYLHIQSTPSAVWTINHNLSNPYLDVTVRKVDGAPILPGTVTKVSANQITIDFNGHSLTGTVSVRGLTIY